MTPGAPELHTNPPQVFTLRAILMMCFWGLLLMVPVVLSILIVSVLRFGFLSFLIPVVTIVTATFFLPLGFGNLYVARLLRPFRPSGCPPEDVFLVQLTKTPRHRSGLLALLEDADDLGFLSLTDAELVFEGDSLHLKIPYEQIREVQLENAGWRALFAYGPRTTFAVLNLPEAGRFTFAERSSWHLPGSRRNAKRIYQRLKARTTAGQLA